MSLGFILFYWLFTLSSNLPNSKLAWVSDKIIHFPEHYPTGCLLGCVTVTDCLAQEEYRQKYPDGESDSPFVFICEDPVALPVRFPMQGQHKICKCCIGVLL